MLKHASPSLVQTHNVCLLPSYGIKPKPGFQGLGPTFPGLFHTPPNICTGSLLHQIPSSVLKAPVLLESKIAPPPGSLQGSSNLKCSHSAEQHASLSLPTLENVWHSVLYYLYVCFICFIRLQVSRGQEKTLIHIN